MTCDEQDIGQYLKSENTYLGADSSHDSHDDLLDPTKVGEHNKDN